jgi:hypothetical protein
MKPHYIPQYNESEFNMLSKRVDSYYVSKRRRANMSDIIQKRNTLFRELHDLRMKPRRTREDDRRMAEIENEVREMMLEIGRKHKVL